MSYSRILLEAAEVCRAAFYLVHSMGADTKGFTETDRTAAQNMTVLRPRPDWNISFTWAD